MNTKNQQPYIEIVKRVMKERWILILVTISAVILFLPTKEKKSSLVQENEIKIEDVSYEEEWERKLEQILSCTQGAGKVKVLIKIKDMGEKVVEKDMPVKESTASDIQEKEIDIQTVYEETKDGRQTPYVNKEIVPQIEGVIVAAQGGGDALVAQNLLEAVQTFFQIDPHRIKIMKLVETEGNK